MQSIKRQFELERLQLLLMVNEFRDHLVLNWHVRNSRPALLGMNNILIQPCKKLC